MLVFGDRERRVPPRGEIAAAMRATADAVAEPAGIRRHAAVVGAFARASELAQGVADAVFAADGADDGGPVTVAAETAVRALAGLVRNSLAGRPLDTAAAARALGRLGAAALPGVVVCRRQEGFAHYAVYPEAFVRAADAIGTPVGTVVGIRSIGTGLGALVAAATAAPLFATVRPVGPPFRRELRLGDRLAGRLAAADGVVAVVDEGPGLSGSSFAAVARALVGLGIGADRIRFVTSHGGEPGSEADGEIRGIWRRTGRHAADGAAIVAGAGAPFGGVAGWCADLTGPPTAPPLDVGGGRWRHVPPGDPAAPALPAWERPKWLVATARGRFLLRFAGLGAQGEAALARAETLAAAGFTPPVLGLRHGFLVERWLDDARPLRLGAADRAGFVDHLARYLAFRARRLPAADDAGAGLDALAAMLVRNAGLGLGRTPDGDAWVARAAALAPRVRRIETDNRLDPHEWLRCADGAFVKTDAVDHVAAHDLVGAQDVAWDVAAAIDGFALSADEARRLVAAMAAAGVAVDGELVAFYRPCRAAFELGRWTLLGGGAGGTETEARARADTIALHARTLETLLR